MGKSNDESLIAVSVYPGNRLLVSRLPDGSLLYDSSSSNNSSNVRGFRFFLLSL